MPRSTPSNEPHPRRHGGQTGWLSPLEPTSKRGAPPRPPCWPYGHARSHRGREYRRHGSGSGDDCRGRVHGCASVAVPGHRSPAKNATAPSSAAPSSSRSSPRRCGGQRCVYILLQPHGDGPPERHVDCQPPVAPWRQNGGGGLAIILPPKGYGSSPFDAVGGVVARAGEHDEMTRG